MEYYVIQEWEASYYCWKSKTWKYGKLNLSSKYVCFFELNSESETISLSVTADLRNITGFQRRFASLIYKAIVVGVEGGKPLWFSSLPNREEVFYFLEHFWKYCLLCLGPGKQKEENQSNKGTTSSSSQASKQKVFELLFNTEDTLIKASNSLYGQGEQFDSSSRMMNRMHKDLNVTETLIDGLDKWFTKWNVQPEHYFEIRTKKEYPILYRKNSMESYSPGTLVFIEGQVTVLNLKRVADVSILLKDLTSIIVNTPWNVLLVRSVIGEVDVLIDVSSAQVAYILKTLQSNHGDKFQYEEDCDVSKQTICIGVSEILPKENVILTENDETKYTDGDIEVVRDMVGTMKSLALDVNQEITRQLDSLDQLSDSMDKANYRIKKGSRKVEKKL